MGSSLGCFRCFPNPNKSQAKAETIKKPIPPELIYDAVVDQRKASDETIPGEIDEIRAQVKIVIHKKCPSTVINTKEIMLKNFHAALGKRWSISTSSTCLSSQTATDEELDLKVLPKDLASSTNFSAYVKDSSSSTNLSTSKSNVAQGDYRLWISDPQLRKEIQTSNNENFLLSLPLDVANDILCKCQVYIDAIDAAFTIDLKSQLVQDLYNFLETKFQNYHDYLNLKWVQVDQIRIFVEDLVIAHIHQNIFYRISSKFELSRFYKQLEKIEQLFDAMRIKLSLEEEEFLNLTSLNLNTIALDIYPKWKWWCISQWGKNIESFIEARHNPIKNDGQKILLTLYCLTKMHFVKLQEEIFFLRLFSHPIHKMDTRAIYFFNILAYALESVPILSQCTSLRPKVGLSQAIDVAYKMAFKLQDEPMSWDKDIATYKDILSLTYFRPRGWKEQLQNIEQERNDDDNAYFFQKLIKRT